MPKGEEDSGDVEEGLWDELIREEELKKAVQHLKSKAPGEDGLENYI